MARYRLCDFCQNFRQVPMSPSADAKGFEPLVKCRVEDNGRPRYFGEMERNVIPVKNRCPDFDGDLKERRKKVAEERKKEKRRLARPVQQNLGERLRRGHHVLCPHCGNWHSVSTLEIVYKLAGPGKLYCPSKKRKKRIKAKSKTRCLEDVIPSEYEITCPNCGETHLIELLRMVKDVITQKPQMVNLPSEELRHEREENDRVVYDEFKKIGKVTGTAKKCGIGRDQVRENLKRHRELVIQNAVEYLLREQVEKSLIEDKRNSD